MLCSACRTIKLEPTAVQLSPELMPDALHPNAAGMALLAECILPFVKLYGGAGMQA